MKKTISYDFKKRYYFLNFYIFYRRFRKYFFLHLDSFINLITKKALETLIKVLKDILYLF